MVGGSGGVGERYDLNSLFLIKINFYSCVCVCVYSVCKCAGALGGQKRALDLLNLDLELQMAVNWQTWKMGTELWSSKRSVSTLNH